LAQEPSVSIFVKRLLIVPFSPIKKSSGKIHFFDSFFKNNLVLYNIDNELIQYTLSLAEKDIRINLSPKHLLKKIIAMTNETSVSKTGKLFQSSPPSQIINSFRNLIFKR
jgi:hypothetical protein